MRELKFRAWDKITKRYYAVSGLEYDDDGELCEVYLAGIQISESNPDANVREPSDVILEQYTSLKDKNGKEIWEGDIVKVEDDKHTNDVDKFLGDNATVTTSELLKPGAFVIKNWYGERHLRWDIPLSRVEVIGNIHENPELLSGEEE